MTSFMLMTLPELNFSFHIYLLRIVFAYRIYIFYNNKNLHKHKKCNSEKYVSGCSDKIIMERYFDQIFCSFFRAQKSFKTKISNIFF